MISKTAMRRITLGVVVTAGLTLAACSSTNSSSSTTEPPLTVPITSPSTAPASTAPSSAGSSTTTAPASTSNGLMSVDASAQTVTFNVSLGDQGMTINGKSGGAEVFTVPVGWKVTLNCKNNSSGIPHSCGIDDSQGNQNIQFNAATSNSTGGMSAGTSQSVTFTASTAGSYRLSCLVPGHEQAGMYATFNVVASGSPSVS